MAAIPALEALLASAPARAGIPDEFCTAPGLDSGAARTRRLRRAQA